MDREPSRLGEKKRATPASTQENQSRVSVGLLTCVCLLFRLVYVVLPWFSCSLDVMLGTEAVG